MPSRACLGALRADAGAEANAAHHRRWCKRKRAEAKRAKAEELRALRRRAAVALELVTAGELSGGEALVAVVWPQSARLHAAPYVAEWPAELRREAVELYAAGWSLPALARRLGVSYGAAKSWILASDVRRNGAVVQRPAYNSVP